jgi:single-stranded-DNA-specific exonuclease
MPDSATDSGAEPGFLGVERSIGGRRWYARGGDDRIGLAIAQRLGVPELVGRLIAGRGIGIDEAEQFLSPSLRDQLPNPSVFLDMDQAADRVARAIETSETIAIFGDYDVDGATSTAVLSRFFQAVGTTPILYIPDRQAEGYGPNTAALLKLKAGGASLAITVDCGATAHTPLAAAKEAGLDVIVCDHHVGEPALPPALAVVNPNRFDEQAGHRELAAVGVAFLLAVAVNRTLRARGWYGTARREPDLLQLLDLVAVGTVCDVVPLLGVNRALVAQGLRVLASRQNCGLAALADIAGLSERPDAYHLGYIFGPRINAGGRVGNAGLGARLLTTDDPAEARKLAEELHRLNDERRQIEAEVLDLAIKQLEAQDPSTPEAALVFAAGEAWHPGVIGIVASRLKDRYNRPALVAAIGADGIAKGSGRSIPGFALGDAMIAARQAGLLINGGGHAMAAGFTAEAVRLPELQRFLDDRARMVMTGGTLTPRLGIDGALDCRGATPDLIESLARVGPFGSGNAEPRFAITRALVTHADVVGTAHVRATLSGTDGGRLKAIAFRVIDANGTPNPLALALLNRQGQPLHIAGTLRADTWGNRNGVQLLIDDAAEIA